MIFEFKLFFYENSTIDWISILASIATVFSLVMAICQIRQAKTEWRNNLINENIEFILIDLKRLDQYLIMITKNYSEDFSLELSEFSYHKLKDLDWGFYILIIKLNKLSNNSRLADLAEKIKILDKEYYKLVQILNGVHDPFLIELGLNNKLEDKKNEFEEVYRKFYKNAIQFKWLIKEIDGFIFSLSKK